MSSTVTNLLIIIIVIAIAFIIILYLRRRSPAKGAGDYDLIFAGGEEEPKSIYISPDFKTQSKFELHIQKLLERITGKPFPTAYPKWLTYKGRQLELDGYNEGLKMAFEAQGPMHSRYDHRYDPTYEKYYRRLENDCAKKKLCKRRGIDLILIHYDLPKHLLELYMRSRIYDIYKSRGKDSPYGDKPANYMMPHQTEIYRNHVYEKELGLDVDLCRANI